MNGSDAPAIEATVTRPSRHGLGARGFRWWIALSSVTIAVSAPLPYLMSSLERLSADHNQIASNYVHRPGWAQVVFYGHVCAGGLAMLVAPLQLSSRARRTWPLVHRVGGRVGLAAIWLAAVAGLILAPFSIAGTMGLLGFGALAVAWFVCGTATYVTIRSGDRAGHRRWAIRTFALTYAAVTLRLWLGVLIAFQVMVLDTGDQVAFDRSYALVPFLAWVPNLIAAEWYLRRRERANELPYRVA